MITRRSLIGVLALLLVDWCTVRLVGQGPLWYRAHARSMDTDATPIEVASVIRQAGADLVLMAARSDSVWFSEVARASNLELSGPGLAGDVSLAFLGAKPLGDTTLALELETGGSVVVHDALYQVDRGRYLDLLVLRVESASAVRSTMQALLRYIASDVMSNAAVVLAVDVPDSVTGDAVAAILDPAFIDAQSCLDPGKTVSGQAAPATHLGAGRRLFYGAEARLRCGGRGRRDGCA